jgi:hypothetical protein
MENLFRKEKNYSFFLKKYHHHTHAVAETFAFCLLSNIHNNPVKHGFQKTPWDWPYSSIHGILLTPSKGLEFFDDFPTKIPESTKEKVINWFGNADEFARAHAPDDINKQKIPHDGRNKRNLR